ncbi:MULTISPECIES: peptide-binding protein [Bacillus]|nr:MULTISPECIES: peptide-binding protein [Bacillus]
MNILKEKKRWLQMLVFVLVLGLLAACNGGGDKPASDDGKGEEASGEPQKGGTLTGAMDTPPEGVFNPIYYTSAYEANILDFTHEGLLTQNKDLEFIENLAESWEFNDDQTEVTFKLRENAKWHDGEPFTADDVVFTYKTLSTPGYAEAGGVRQDFAVRLLGYEEFSTGASTEFPGVVAVDDHTVTFKFAAPNVTALKDASFDIIPEHIFKDVPIADIPKHEGTLEAGKVIGTGPFKFTEMVDGEQYVLERNEDYWQGAPYLDKIVWRIVDQAVILGMLENGEVDFVAEPNGFQAADYETVDAMENLEIIEQPDFGYQIMGFMVNHRTPEDAASGAIKPENWVPNEKLSNKNVRQAIAYAVNRQGLIDGLLYGQGNVINAPIATQFPAYDDEKPNQYKFDPKKAKEMLDKEGYVDTNNDGFREDPQGNEWVLTMNYPTGNKLRERSAPIIQEMLQDVGIKVDLRQPMEFPVYAEALEKDNQDWDIYLLGWSLDSGDPDPSGLWSTDAGYNYGRWNNPEADQLLLDAMKAPEAFDAEYRNKVYSDWQVKFQDDLPALILYAQNSLWAHNKRLQGVDELPYSMINKPHLWWVTE